MEWLVRMGYETIIPEKIWDTITQPELTPECQILKKNLLRTSILMPLSEAPGAAVFVKRNHPRHWKDDLQSLFLPSRALSEWKSLRHFERLQIPAPHPLAFGEKRERGILKDSCLVIEAIGSARSLNSYCGLLTNKARKSAAKNLQDLISPLARAIARLHASGVYYRDLHGGNILCREDSTGKVEIVFVDTDKVRFLAKPTQRTQVRDLAMLYNSLFTQDDSGWSQFLTIYREGEKISSLLTDDFSTKIETVARTFRERHVRSRTKRCLKRTTAFNIGREKKRILYFRREVSAEDLHAAVDTVHRTCPDGKRKRFRLVIPFRAPYSSVEVNQYGYSMTDRLKSLIFFSPAKAHWVHANGLLARDVPTPLPIALVEEKGAFGVKAGMVFTENPASCCRLGDYIRNTFFNAGPDILFVGKIRFVREFAESIATLYQNKICFGNLTAEHILVNEARQSLPTFCYRDLEEIDFNRSIVSRKMIKNLTDLNESLPFDVSRRERLRFLFYFVRSWPRETRRAFVKQTLKRIQ